MANLCSDTPHAVALWVAFDGRAAQEQVGGGLVRLHEFVVAQAGECPRRPLDPLGIEPRLPVFIHVDATDRVAEPCLQKHLAEVGAFGQVGDKNVALQVLPAERGELSDERELNEV